MISSFRLRCCFSRLRREKKETSFWPGHFRFYKKIKCRAPALSSSHYSKCDSRSSSVHAIQATVFQQNITHLRVFIQYALASTHFHLLRLHPFYPDMVSPRLQMAASCKSNRWPYKHPFTNQWVTSQTATWL